MANVGKIKSISQDLATMAKRLTDFSIHGDTHDDQLATPEDVRTHLQIFSTVNAWYDKTVTKKGHLAALVDSLSDEDKDYLIKLASLDETEQKKFK